MSDISCKSNRPEYLADGDGIDHINIYSRGQTYIGRMLSHFPEVHFKHPYLGPFCSMEGFWYYVRSEVKDDALRSLYGYEAKKYGKTLKIRRFAEFPEIIMDANYQKIVQNKPILDAFVNSDLPFDHYYLFGRDKVLVRPVGFDFLIEGFTKLREMLKNGEHPAPLDYRSIFARVFSDRQI